jgi:autotransporter-associated beta strand protein
MVLLNDANNVTLAVLSDTTYTNNNLTWKGYVNGVWDTTTLNWLGGIYADGFDVTFDDSALNYTVTGGNVAPGAMTFNDNNDYTVSANMGGAGSLTKNLSGTLTLTGTNTFTGDVTMGSSGGSAHNPLTLAGNGRLGSSTSKLLTASPRYLITIQDSAIATFTNILLNCINPGSQQNRLNQTGGTLNCLGTGTGANAAMQLGTGGTYLMTYNFSGGTLNVTNGDLGLSMASTALNALVQSGGTANLKGVHFKSGGKITLSAGTLNLGSDGMTRGASLSTINLVGGTLGAFGDWSSSLPMSLTNTTTVNTLDSFDGATARTITLSGYLAGSGGLTKTGAGMLTLNGTTNSYSGDTIVSGGTLKLGAAGAVSNSPLIAVASGATCDVSSVTGFTVGTAQTLAGNGTVAGNVIVQGRLAPGGTNAVGALQISANLTLQSGAVLDWDYTPAAADVVTVGGTLTLPATATVSITTTNQLPARTVLFTAPAGININGASDLSGWTLTAPGNSERLSVRVSWPHVYLVPVRGTLIAVF